MEIHDLNTILKVNVVKLKSLSTIIFESLSNKIRNNKVCNRTSCTLAICFNNRLVRLHRSVKMKIQLIGLQSTNTFQLRNDEFIKLRVLGFKKQVQLKSVLLTVNYSFEVNKYIADVSFSVCLFYCSFFSEKAHVFREKRPQSRTCQTSWKQSDRTYICDCLNKLKIFDLK